MGARPLFVSVRPVPLKQQLKSPGGVEARRRRLCRLMSLSRIAFSVAVRDDLTALIFLLFTYRIIFFLVFPPQPLARPPRWILVSNESRQGLGLRLSQSAYVPRLIRRTTHTHELAHVRTVSDVIILLLAFFFFSFSFQVVVPVFEANERLLLQHGGRMGASITIAHTLAHPLPRRDATRSILCIWTHKTR